MNDFAIEPASPTTIDALRQIRLEALSNAPDAFGSTLDEALSFSTERWLAMLSTNTYFLAMVGDDAVGMIGGGRHVEFPGEHWVYGMYVTPRYRGSSCANDLVSAVVAWAANDGARSLSLRVTLSMGRALAFYQKVGFREVGERIRMPRKPTLVLAKMQLDLPRE